MKRTLAHVVKLALVIALAAGASARLLQAQLPQGVGTWLSRGAVADPRVGAAAVTLDDGRTVVAGGTLADGSVTDRVTVYDPVSNATMAAGQLFVPRVNASATLLADGRVLVTGGLVGGAPSADVEIFDLATGASTFAATMAEPRAWHASARLFDGAVLIVGGATSNGSPLSSAEIFEPETNNIYPAGLMTTPRMGASATTLIDHRVLIAGGNDGTQELATAEIYNASTSTFTIVPTQMTVARSGHTALLLPHNGGVLLAGGSAAGTTLTTTDLFVPAIFPDPYSWGMGSFAPTGSLNASRAFAIGGPLGDNGFAYVAGGGSADAEAYRFATIKTDKVDYYPGEPAVITGSGWQPGEEVSLLFQEDPAVHDDYRLTVTADSNGDVYWDEWAPDWHDLGVRFYLTAQDSRSHVQMTFTDAPRIGAVTLGTQTPNPLLNTASNTATFSVATARTGNGTVNGTFSVTFALGVPPGITSTFAPATFTANGGNAFPPSTLTFTTNGTTPAGSYAFTVRTADGSDVSTGGTGTLVVAAGAATKLVFDQQSTSSTVATTISPAVTVRILDGGDNLVASDTRNVTLAIGTNPSSGTLAGTTTVAAVGGIATFSNLSIDNAGNNYTLAASSVPALVGATSSAFNIGKASQTITFGALATRTFGDADFTVVATASSGLTVSFSSLTAAVCSVTGASVHLIAAGTCTIRASQAGNANFNAAANVDQSFTVLKATPVITWPTPAAITYPTALSAVQLNATTPVAGTFTYTPAAGTVLSAGNTQVLSVAFAPTDTTNFNAVPVTTVLIDVLKAAPVITWPTPASITYPTALSAVQLNATADVAGSFTYTPASGTVLNAGNAQVLSVAFAPTDTTNYNAVPVTTVVIDVLKATPVITWPTPAAITYPTALSATQLNATTPVAGTFTYTPASGTVLNAGNAQVLSVAFAPTDTTNYNAVPVTTVVIDVLKATPVITWPTPAAITYPTALSATQLNATTPVAGTFTYTPASGTVLNAGNAQVLSVAFAPTDTTNYNAVPVTTVVIDVLKATPVITWPTPAAITYPTALSATQLNATTPVAGTFTYTPASGTVLNAGNAQVLSVAFAPTDTTNYNAVPVTTVLIDVLKATPVITWPTPAAITYPTALSATQLNATTPVAGTFTYTPASGAILNAGNAQVLSVAFAPTDTTNYNPVPVTTVLIDVLKATPVITWPTPAAITYPTALSATQLNASTPVAGTFTYTPASGTVLNAGNAQVLSVAFAPTDTTNYNAVPVTTVLIDVLKATPVITWPTPASITYPTALSAVQLNASTPVAGTFTYTPASGTVLNAGNAQVLSVAFAPTDTTNYNPVPVTTVLIDVLKATPVITWPTPAAITYPTALSAVQLNASTPVAGTFTYIPASDTVLNAGNAQVLSVAFEPLDTTNYNAVPLTTVLIDVLKATPVITWPTPAAITYPTALSATQLNATTPVAGTFTYTPASGTVLNAGTAQVLSVAFAPMDTTNYNAVPVTTVLIDVQRKALTVTATGMNKVYNGTNAAAVMLSDDRRPGDDLTIAFATATFNNRNVGVGKPIAVNGITVTGSAAGNYTFNTSASAVADITVRSLLITAVSDSRAYNGTKSSVGVPTVGTLYTPDTVTGLVQEFDSRHVGINKTLSVSAYVVNDGNGGNNYAVTPAPNIAGVITQRAVTVTGITANNKPFDGTTAATLNLGGATLVGTIAGDSVTLNTASASGAFSSSAVGTWPVAISGLVLAGADKDNYSLAQPSTTASIGAWSVLGFHTPVGIANSYAGTPPVLPAIWNTIKGGQAVPLKFNLFATAGGSELTNVTDVLGFSLASLPCSAGAEDPVDPEFVTTGATTLRYSGGQFIQNWDTPKGANKCYRVTMTARDGSLLSAFFKTK